MKLKYYLSFFCGLFLILSCETTKDLSSNSSQPQQGVWEGGITQITGEVISVVEDKDGQALVLKDQNGAEQRIRVNELNLGERASQYRQFRVGETISLRGIFNQNGELQVTEILELM